jgi:hypothetical protein
MAPSSRSPDLPEATPVCAVSGQLRRPRQWSVMSPIRRLHSSRSRKYRSFVDGVVKGANRPFDALQEPPSERQEARESSSWLKAPVAPGESIAGPIGNFRFGRTPGVSQRSPRPLPALSRYHGSGIRCEILTTGGGAPIALLLSLQYAYRLRPAWTQARRELHDLGGPFLLPARRVIRVTAAAEEMCTHLKCG